MPCAWLEPVATVISVGCSNCQANWYWISLVPATNEYTPPQYDILRDSLSSLSWGQGSHTLSPPGLTTGQPRPSSWPLDVIIYPIYTCTLAMAEPWPSEVLFTLGELYPCQTGHPREDCLGEDLGEGQV